MAMISNKLLTACALSLMVTGGSAADSFLQKHETESLFADVACMFGEISLQARVNRLELQLQSMFGALPKSRSERVAPSTARYALNRVMAGLYGWSLPGLEHSNATVDATSLVRSGVLNKLMPDHLKDIFAKHIDPEGFNLRELAILVGTVESLVHDDQQSKLLEACQLLDIATAGPMQEEELQTIITLYMISFIGHSENTKSDIRQAYSFFQKGFEKTYPGWVDVATFLTDEREMLVFNDRAKANPFKNRESTFEVAQRVVEQIAGKFSRTHGLQVCKEMESDLFAYERGETGRIHLADFYRASLESRVFYVETKDYLRALGALDESDPVVGDKVIVANFVQGKSSCTSHGNFYNICCINECEELYAALEKKIGAPEGSPAQLAALVALISTETVHAPRNLSQMLLRRLDEIAAHHGGYVQLHGRLFAQWLHQAFPHECPYPHRSGTVTALGPAAWAQQHPSGTFRMDTNFSKAEYRAYVPKLAAEIEASSAMSDDSLLADEMELAWSSEEEVLIEPTRSPLRRLKALLNLANAFVLAALVAIFFVTQKLSEGVSNAGDCGKDSKYFV